LYKARWNYGIIVSPYFRHVLLSTTFYHPLHPKKKRCAKTRIPFLLSARDGRHSVAIKKPTIKNKKRRKTMINTKQYEPSQKVNKKKISNFELAQMSKRVINSTLKYRIGQLSSAFDAVFLFFSKILARHEIAMSESREFLFMFNLFSPVTGIPVACCGECQ